MMINPCGAVQIVRKIEYSRYQCGVIIKSDIHSEMMQNN